MSDMIEVFDTTLRDGLQVEGVSATVEDKLRIAEQLDHLGVHFIEGGWPGANPKDIEFFARAAHDLRLSTSTLVAFGSTRRPRGKVDDDATLRNLIDANTSAVCIVAKSWDYHVLEALQTTLDEGEAMIADSVEYLVANGRRVLVDMEHFFDGYKRNPEFALRALEAAIVKGASHVVLCDTNGGSLPHEVQSIVGDVKRHIGDDAIIGIHCHDDTGCAVANSVAAVLSGARHVQGTLNGLGERTGNTNLTTVIPNLQLKMGFECLPAGRIERLTAVSNHVAEVLNRPLNPQAPYVGASAFAHKAGLHVSAIARAKDAYEHVDPDLVGNGTRFVVSEMAGRATITMKAEELGLPMDGPAVNQVIDDLKRLEHEGYHFEAADASLELLMRRATGWDQQYFRVESMRVITDETMTGAFSTEATVKVWVGPEGSATRHVFTAEGNGPVNAIDKALRAAVMQAYPQIARVHLTDYKVRILDGATATGAVTRVLIDASDGERTWTTIGVSPNIIEASWRALEESLVYGLLHASN
ncbi:MAG: citramalate synthase [Acidimicrobiales bacterium mtb01]|nr:citramalate synthase [Actinomycetota bacterium]TEX47279.1 MAG: citramalate synthase [Acidimicrobiales bacterium mtb01]